MASTENTPKRKIASFRDLGEGVLRDLTVHPRKQIPSDYAERRKTIRPTDLFKPVHSSAQFVQKFGIIPDDGIDEIGKAVARVLYKLFQSFEDWSHGQGDFTQAITKGMIEEDYIKENELNVIVFHDNKSGMCFTNAWFQCTDDTAWLGLLDKQYYICVFESCWFKRHGPGGYENWAFRWWTNGRDDDERYEARSTVDQESNKIVIVYHPSPKTAKKILNDYLDGYDSEYDMYMNVIRSTSTYHNSKPTVYTVNHYGINDWYTYTINAEDVSDGIQDGVRNGVEQFD